MDEKLRRLIGENLKQNEYFRALLENVIMSLKLF